MSDIRSVLEGIAYGDDPAISPSDRLRAAERLLELDPTPTVDEFEREIASWDEAKLDTELDALCAESIMAALREDNGRWPRLAAHLRQTVEERARELADRDAIEREIEAKVKERSRWLLEREIGMATVTPVVSGELKDATPSSSSPPRQSVPRPPGVEPNAGFSRRARRK
jgi:hypothetical protein